MSRLIDHPSVDPDSDLIDEDFNDLDYSRHPSQRNHGHTIRGQNPFDENQHLDEPYYHHEGSTSNPYLTPIESQRSFFNGAGVAADVDKDDFLQTTDSFQTRPKSGIGSVFTNVKSKLGFSQKADYSEMDLPLTNVPTNTQGRSGYNDGRNINYDMSGALESDPNVYDSARSAGVPTRTRKLGGSPDSPPPDRDFDMRRIWNRMLGRKGVTQTGPRVISINDSPANAVFGYQGNHISTTKYNIATFLPKFLFEQFSKYANLFFLCTSAIQQVPGVTPTNRYTTIGTLLVVLCVSAVKELVEDFKRSSADKELNSSKVEILVDGRFQEVKWIHVHVGDIVRVTSEQPFPADLILLASSEPEGLCYIETANLDGETNLKIKQARPETAELVSEHQLAHLQGKIVSEQPNSSLYTYDGTLEIPPNTKIPLAPDQLLLRGATLRNTPWIHGIVVFTGHETKLMRNATAAPIKRTRVEHMINLQIIFLFTILIVLAFVSSLGNVITIHNTTKKAWYLKLAGVNLIKQFFADILTYWILFSNLVPISLFVTVEIIKFYQAFLISSDLDMYYGERDVPAVCRTSSLVEELGQIEYIFSDKTGTLTRNIMEFKACSIAGRCYALEVPDDRRVQVLDNGTETGYHDFDVLREDMDSEKRGQIIQELLTLLASCHTVIPEVLDNGEIKYQAASPDEGALVEGAASLGFKFSVRKPKGISIDIKGLSYDYELLNICEFNSTRKRMSAVFRCPDGRIRLYCKGADNVILERLAPENPFVQDTMLHLEDFAGAGLRTLCLAMRVIEEDEYIQWSQRFDEAATSMENRSELLDEVAEEIEHDMFLLGATAIEDKLQEGVPETIHTLQEANIKIWVLTGDRQETAINIGMSCRLLSEDMNLLIVNEETFEDTADNIRRKLSVIRNQKAGRLEFDTMALVIDGKSLDYALQPELERDLLDLAILCKSVVCCRVSPLQKALVVKLVKRYTKSLLLAIGDGANDVSMIQAAHVGVGISGMEGTQAARSADVSVGQFRYLRKLLLVHGSWSYQRLSVAILYSFYKNIALYMTQFWYVFGNGFSGQSIYESWTITFYNVLCTVLPPFVMGIFDQFVSARLLDRYPQLYQLGQKNIFLNVKHFWEWVVNGFYHSVILYVGSVYAYRFGSSLMDGEIADHWTWGTAAFTACVITALGKAALVTNTWNKYTIIAIPGSLVIWLGFFPAYATIAPLINVSTEYKGVLPHLYPTLVFWVSIIVLPCMCLLRDFAWKYYRRMYAPQSYHYVQEIQKFNIADYRPRMEQFQKAIRKVRQVQRMRKQRGFAFSQTDQGGQATRVIRAYDTTQKRGRYGELGHSQN